MTAAKAAESDSSKAAKDDSRGCELCEQWPATAACSCRLQQVVRIRIMMRSKDRIYFTVPAVGVPYYLLDTLDRVAVFTFYVQLFEEQLV